MSPMLLHLVATLLLHYKKQGSLLYVIIQNGVDFFDFKNS